jgi:hypothetical protein
MYSYIFKNVKVRKKFHELGEIPTSSLFFAFSQPSAADY